MGAHDFQSLAAHIGHEIKVVRYGDRNTDFNVAIECWTCNEVLLDFDNAEIVAIDSKPSHIPDGDFPVHKSNPLDIIDLTEQVLRSDIYHQKPIIFDPSPLIIPLLHGPAIPEKSPVHNNSRPIYEIVIEDILKRNEMGCKKYGGPLQAGDGRSGLWDAYQESIDLVLYLRKEIIEEILKENGENGG